MTEEWEKARALFIEHNRRTMAESEPEGWAVAIVGSKRSSYLAFNASRGKYTYDEAEAHIYREKQEACAALAQGVDRDLFRFSQVVAVDGHAAHIKGGKLPTVNGY